MTETPVYWSDCYCSLKWSLDSSGQVYPDLETKRKSLRTLIVTTPKGIGVENHNREPEDRRKSLLFVWFPEDVAYSPVVQAPTINMK